MARIFKLELDLYGPREDGGPTCVEAYETVRRAPRNRVLHFALRTPPTEDDIRWLCDVYEAEIRTLVGRTCGTQQELSF